MSQGQSKTSLTSQQIYAKWSKAVVTLKTSTSTGTGFFDSTGQLYTAYHVIKGADKVTVVFSDGFKVESLWVTAAHPETDIAVLVTGAYKGREKRQLGPPLGDWASCKVGEKLTVIGSPLGLSGTLTEGLLSGKRTDSDASYLQLSASISPGSSGSPVLNSKGQVVGMAVGELKGGQNLNFAVSVKDLKEAWVVPLSLLVQPKPEEVKAPAVETKLLPVTGSALLTSPGLVSNVPLEFRGLEGVDKFTILVEGLSDQLSGKVTETDVTGWMRAVLFDAGLGGLIVERDSKRETFLMSNPKTELETLKMHSEHRATLYININAMVTTEGLTFYSMSLDFQRGVFVFPGRYDTASVFNRDIAGYFGKSHSTFDRLSSVVKEQVSKFADALKAARNAGNGSKDEGQGKPRLAKREVRGAPFRGWVGGFISLELALADVPAMCRDRAD